MRAAACVPQPADGFFLCGLWHGAKWTFVIWGLFHGLFLVIERLGLEKWLTWCPAPVRHLYVLLVVMTGWVLFRADTFSYGLSFLAALSGLGHGDGIEYHAGLYLDTKLTLTLVAGIVGALPVLPFLRSMREWTLARYLFVIAPTKSAIYPELMPASINRIRQESRLDQFLAHMQANSDVAVLDVREPLREAKIQQQVYSQMDSHWNKYGAFIAYQQLMNCLAVWFPQLHAQPVSAFALRSTLTAQNTVGILVLCAC